MIKKNRIFQNFLILILLVIGILTVKNYGISYDELEYRQQGFVVLNDIAERFFPKKSKLIKEEREIKYPTPKEYMGNIKNNFKIHHTIFAALEFIFLKDSEKKDVYLMRHYLNFLMSMLMIIFFYKTLRLNFSREISMIGSAFFLINPRIYPDFFYNPNDIWFSFFLVLCIYNSLIFFKKKSLIYFLILPILISLAINVRIIGIYIYFIFLLIFLFKCVNKEKEYLKILKYLGLQIIILILSLYLLTPQTWDGGILSLYHLFLGQLSYNPIDPNIMFMGKLISASETAWYYLPLWILISTPVIYIFLFLIGNICLFYTLVFEKHKNSHFNYYLILGYFFLPLFAYFIFRPTIFNGWRHFYFLYPGLIYLSTIGINFIYNWILSFNNQKIIFFYYTILIGYFLSIIFWSIQNHPYQYVFLNSFSQKYFNKFEKDYWGVSNLDAIKFILSKDKKDKITIVGVENSRIDFSLMMLSKNEKKRINLKKFDEVNKSQVDYYISHFNDEYDTNYYKNSGYKIFNEIKVEGKNINIIFTN